MWPRTKEAEENHRRRKRELEASIAVKELSHFLPKRDDSNCCEILEFGSGEGLQIPYLSSLGRLTVSDIYLTDQIEDMRGEKIRFVKCSIDNTPFDSESFDIIYSNHVLEHIENLDAAFSELKRIGRPDCVYAFCVPTNIWLLLSIPAQYYRKAQRLFKDVVPSNKEGYKELSDKDLNIWTMALPRGHGFNRNFLRCYSFLKVTSWQNLFRDNGFRLLRTYPLLLYAPSEWPIVPTTRFLTNLGVSSSAMFIMKKER